MHSYPLQFLFIFFIFPSLLIAQNNALSVGYGLGITIPNHPKFPEIKGPSHYGEMEWIHDNPLKLWSMYNRGAKLHLSGSFQSFGNLEVTGIALGFTPYVSLLLFKKNAFKSELQLGWGLGWLSKKFDSFYNPANIVVGTHFNSSVAARLECAYRIKNFEPFLRLAVQHYSNGNAMSPNLGFNTPLVQAGLTFHYKTLDPALPLPHYTFPVHDKRFSPFIQLGIGFTANISRGPFFPVYNINAGAQYLYKPARSIWAALEYSFNSSSYHFYINNGADYQVNDFNRYALWVGHEWIFGRLGFLAIGGIYLNRHIGQRSIFPTQTGINFYPKLPYRYNKQQFWMGVHIRAYFGLADYVMLQMGYRF
jgi:hypothetical protein